METIPSKRDSEFMADVSRDYHQAAPSRSVRPAEGERRAVGGFHAQYRVSASLVYRSLRDNSLRWIRVADPDAGRVDDLQIGSQSRVDAYQVKSSQYGGNFSFNDLTRESDAESSLIGELASGWRLLGSALPGNRIVVHLITNQTPSTADSLPSGSDVPVPNHFAAFLGQAWQPVRESQPEKEASVPARWQIAWDAIQKSSGLSEEEFRSFIRDCELEFGYQPTSGDITTASERSLIVEDLEAITNTLFSTVADRERIIELNRGQLLSRLGWQERFEFLSRHEFPIDEVLYRPIQSTIDQFEQRLNQTTAGYIAVLGSPGSGKSTSITKFLQTRPERVIPYYSYVPDSHDPNQLRGESRNFLHDIVLALENAGFAVGQSLIRLDRDQLLTRFHQQLRLLHEEWKRDGQRTIILIDGLDHISREQHPDRSLLVDLPDPEQVPDGIIFLLGSQTDEIFPPRIQQVVRAPERNVQMGELDRQAVLELIDLFGLQSNPSSEHKDKIYELSGGHPLALTYLLNRLKHLASADTLETMLQGTEKFEGDIEVQYNSYWREFGSDYQLQQLLGLIARIRVAIDLSWAETWADDASVHQLRQRWAHYFRVEDKDRWYFFHNSFRLFLLDKTAESSPGVVDPERDRAFHKTLANQCQQSSDPRWQWEELYHRHSAGEHSVVLERATQQMFRTQLFNYRPPAAIETDIKTALRAAAAVQDPIAVARLILAGSEIADRASCLEEASPLPVITEVLDPQIVSEYIRNGRRLRVGAGAALNTSVGLMANGWVAEASRVFALATPIHLLNGSAAVELESGNDPLELLETWASTATHFYPVETIINKLRGLVRVQDRAGANIPDEELRLVQNRLLFSSGIEYLDNEEWDCFRTTLAAFDVNRDGDHSYWFWLQLHFARKLASKAPGEAFVSINEILAHVETGELAIEERVALARSIYRILGNSALAQEWIEDIPQPELQTDLFSSREGLEPFNLRFDLTRLSYALGNRITPPEIIPDSTDERDYGIIQFERGICSIAQIWAKGWLGQTLDRQLIELQTLPLLRLFNHPWEETRRWHSWHTISVMSGEFYSLLIEAVGEHGFDAVDALRNAFQNEWEGVDTNNYWPAIIRRQVIKDLFNAGAQKQWATQQLQIIEAIMLHQQDTYGQVEQCVLQAQAWMDIQDENSARRVLGEAYRVSFGVGSSKDYQLDQWVTWLGKINDIEPEKAAQRISWLARAIVNLEKEVGIEGTDSAINEILAITFRWSPRRAIRLFNWFREQGTMNYLSALRVLLLEAGKCSDKTGEVALLATSDFLLPLSNAAYPELASILVDKVNQDRGATKGTALIHHLCSNVRKYALPSTRNGWYRGIAEAVRKLGLDLEAVGIESSDLRSDRDDDGSYRNLKLASESDPLSFEQVVSRISTPADLQQLSEDELEDSNFHWEEVVPRIFEGWDRGQIISVVDIFAKKRRPALILAAVSQCLYSLGDDDTAWDLGFQALGDSHSLGWTTWYDGGSRLAAFRALAKIDSIRIRPDIYRTLVEDLVEEHWFPRNFALHLPEILPLLVDEIPVPAIWSMVEEYLDALLSSISIAEDVIPGLDKLPEEDSPYRSISELIIGHLNHPCFAVANCAQRLCAKLLSLQNSDIRSLMQEHLEADGADQGSIIAVLDAVSSRDPNLVAEFKSIIELLSSSPDWSIRQGARSICERCGWQVPTEAVGVKQLPSIYNISLPPRNLDFIASQTRVSSQLPQSDTEDPVRLIMPFLAEIKFISSIAHVNPLNTCHRVAEIMNELSPSINWGMEAEKQLKSDLESMGLRLPFIRPRASMARRAIFHAVVEFIEADRIHLDDFARLGQALRAYDKDMVMEEPSLRPSWIGSISGLGRHVYNDADWLNQIDAGGILIETLTSDGRVILAEETRLKSLEWESPSEMRLSVVESLVESRPPIGEEGEQFFFRIINQVVADYVNINPNEAPIIIRNYGSGYHSAGVDWLALNPAIGLKLGWNLSNEGLFRWVNKQGEIMVESIWWMDGLPDHSPPIGDEVGEGWQVVGSQSAIEQIRKETASLTRVTCVLRKYTKGERTERNEWLKTFYSQ